MDKNILSMEVALIQNPEDLRECTRGSDIEIVQLKPGKLQGSLTHVGIGNLGMTLGRFGSPVRARGVVNPEKITLGMILASAGCVSHWWEDVQLGDVIIFPPGVDHDAIYGGGASYAAISMMPSQLTSVFGGEERLSDPAFWNSKGIQHTVSYFSEEIRRRLIGIISSLESHTNPSSQAGDFLRRSIIEAFATSFIHALPPDRSFLRHTGARLAREAENYIDAAGERPVHISELCSALKVSRRSLHRAFVEVLNMGPVCYLRRRRLSTIQAILKRSNPAITVISDVAFEHGFPEAGRFTAYYRSLFGENPSETLRSLHSAAPRI